MHAFISYVLAHTKKELPNIKKVNSSAMEQSEPIAVYFTTMQHMIARLSETKAQP